MFIVIDSGIPILLEEAYKLLLPSIILTAGLFPYPEPEDNTAIEITVWFNTVGLNIPFFSPPSTITTGSI